MEPLVILTVLATAGVAASLTFAVWRAATKPKDGQAFEDALETITKGSELDTPTVALSVSARKRDQPLTWSSWWAEAAVKSGRQPTDPTSVGRVMAAVAVISLAFGVLVYPGIPGAILVPFAVLGSVRLWLLLEQAKRRAAMDKQMPTLLSGLRAQMHSGDTVQSALMAVADDMPAPLGDELRIARDQINVSVPVDVTLQQTAERVNSRLVQFLVSSMNIAINSGSNLLPQLETIEYIVRQRARIAGKIRSAVALAKPTAYLALAAPPVMFLWMAFTTEGYVSYFLGPGFSSLALAVVLYIFGAIIVRVMVTNVEKI